MIIRIDNLNESLGTGEGSSKRVEATITYHHKSGMLEVRHGCSGRKIEVEEACKILTENKIGVLEKENQSLANELKAVYAKAKELEDERDFKHKELVNACNTANARGNEIAAHKDLIERLKEEIKLIGEKLTESNRQSTLQSKEYRELDDEMEGLKKELELQKENGNRLSKNVNDLLTTLEALKKGRDDANLLAELTKDVAVKLQQELENAKAEITGDKEALFSKSAKLESVEKELLYIKDERNKINAENKEVQLKLINDLDHKQMYVVHIETKLEKAEAEVARLVGLIQWNEDRGVVLADPRNEAPTTTPLSIAFKTNKKFFDQLELAQELSDINLRLEKLEITNKKYPYNHSPKRTSKAKK